MNNFEVSLPQILRYEGGYVNHPNDPGGHTNKGITLAVYSNYLGRQATVDDLKNISDRHVRDIYKTKYWDVTRCDELPTGLDFAVFNICVNGGPRRAVKTLQVALGVEVDGALGPITLQAAKDSKPEEVLPKFFRELRRFYNNLATRRQSMKVFLRGWLNRTDHAEDFAWSLVNTPQPHPAEDFFEPTEHTSGIDTAMDTITTTKAKLKGLTTSGLKGLSRLFKR